VGQPGGQDEPGAGRMVDRREAGLHGGAPEETTPASVEKIISLIEAHLAHVRATTMDAMNRGLLRYGNKLQKDVKKRLEKS